MRQMLDALAMTEGLCITLVRKIPSCAQRLVDKRGKASSASAALSCLRCAENPYILLGTRHLLQYPVQGLQKILLICLACRILSDVL